MFMQIHSELNHESDLPVESKSHAKRNASTSSTNWRTKSCIPDNNRTDNSRAEKENPLSLLVVIGWKTFRFFTKFFKANILKVHSPCILVQKRIFRDLCCNTKSTALNMNRIDVSYIHIISGNRKTCCMTLLVAPNISFLRLKQYSIKFTVQLC